MPRLAVLILALLFALPVFAQDEAARVGQLVKDLASKDWATRERASRELVGIGEPARTALRKAIEDDDPEVRVRASNALIAIGEEFAYAVECATAESEQLREHGRAALMSLFKIDDPKVLRELNQRELQPMWRGYNERLNVLAPPVIALARMQALSGVPILVAEDARETWAKVLSQPTANIMVDGNPEQIPFLRDGVQRFLQQALGGLSAENQLVPRPLRVGRTTILYVTRAGNGTGITRRCGEQLLDDLLKDGEESVRAAALLAHGAASDSGAADHIRGQYVERPELTRLMWLALALGADDKTVQCVKAREHGDAVGLLKSHDWTVLELAAKYLECLEPGPRGEVLGPLVENSTESMELLAAVWVARGASLSDAARARAGRLLKSRQDMLSAAAARWFAGAGDVTDAELEAIWQAGEFQPIDSSFFTAALELVKRPDIADRLAETARKSFAVTFDASVARHALAATVLVGRATPEDLAVALDKLTAARASQRMVNQLAEMFVGCTELPEAALKKFDIRLFDTDPAVRRVYMAALRKCDTGLRVSIARSGVDGHSEREGKHVNVARVSLLGVLAGAGDIDALDEIIKAVEGEDAEVAKAGGAAYADAFSGDALFQALDDLNSRPGLTNGGLAALEGYMEVCRRAAATRDSVTFRKAYGIAINMQILNRNYQLRQELMQLQQLIGSADGKVEKQRALPPDPILRTTSVEVK
ncbi:MAG: HEAT repeat domain-containing protein [Planctomycetes bacterium]|nr:HEAT repeat domain-containing protein [Planctomycetota bacterium]MCB9936203.1 HEAT repeat domain-containing protein [Planctomycetota bacterium]